MLTAPRQNWLLYEERIRPAHAAWVRELAPQAAWDLYRSLYALTVSAGSLPLSPEATQRHWEEKLAIRRRQVAAFSRMDQLRDARRPANDAA